MNQYSREFWAQRIKESLDNGGTIRDAICTSGAAYWDRINAATAKVLDPHIKRGDVILDIACGCGDLVECLPVKDVTYLGIDFVPEFIEEARRRFPREMFITCDLFRLHEFTSNGYDLVIGRGVVDDVVYGKGEWEEKGILPELKRIARRKVILMSFVDPSVHTVIEKGSE